KAVIRTKGADEGRVGFERGLAHVAYWKGCIWQVRVLVGEALAGRGFLDVHRSGPFGKASKLVHRPVIEEEHRDCAVYAIFEAPIYQIVVLVAVKYTHIPTIQRFDYPPECGQVAQHVAAPVLGQHDHVEAHAE